MAESIQDQYPRTVTVKDGRELSFRLMGAGDKDAIVAFAQTLGEEDKIFLPDDISEGPVVDEWLGKIARGRVTTVVAEADGKIVGECSLHHNVSSWRRHIGDVRLLISPDARGAGLGRALVDEIYAIARNMGLKMLTAQMSLDQSAAQTVFRRLGFQREAVLWDYVITADGQTRNLLIATKYL